jgi:hypothetical protein
MTGDECCQQVQHYRDLAQQEKRIPVRDALRGVADAYMELSAILEREERNAKASTKSSDGDRTRG